MLPFLVTPCLVVAVQPCMERIPIKKKKKSPSHFRKINWSPVERKVKLCTSATVFRYWKRIAPSYLNNMLTLFLSNCNTRLQMKLDIPIWRTNKSMTFLDPKIWNKLGSNIKTDTIVSKFIDFVDHK